MMHTDSKDPSAIEGGGNCDKEGDGSEFEVTNSVLFLKLGVKYYIYLKYCIYIFHTFS